MQLESDSELIGSTVEKIKASGALGRSPTYIRLLEHLARVSENGKSCSEVSLAIDVFNKGEDFDVTSDSTVRVYVHNLRQKLNTYYENSGSKESVRLNIPKGSYRLIVEDQPADVEPTGPAPQKPSRSPFAYSTLAFGAALILAGVVFFVLSQNSSKLSDQQLSFWGGILSDEKPVMIVIGDYYIFGENTDDGDIRLVREFDINSPADLQISLDANENLDALRFDMGLTYLPRGSAFALSHIYEVLAHTGKIPRVAMMSELDAEDLHANHIVYLGYLSGLGVLENYTFSASRFDIGFSYDELIDAETGKAYTSNLIDTREDRSFVDYGVLASYANVKGNRIVVIAGTRDAGLMEMSDIAISPDVIQMMGIEESTAGSMISVFEVYGFNLTNISSSLIGGEQLDQEAIWGG